MPFTDQDRELLAAINERTKALPCTRNSERIARVEASGRTGAWILGLLLTAAGLAQGLYCYVR